MKKNTFSTTKHIFLTTLLVLAATLPQNTAHASTISFDPQEKTVGLTTPFTVGLQIDADKPINTISVSMVFPKNITPVDTSDGNSIINFWIDKPVFDEHTRTLTFSGIIPGGYTGTGGRLILLTLVASSPGKTVLSADAAHSVVYLNTPDAVQDQLSIQPVTLWISPQKDNISNNVPDTVQPEPFSPSLIHVHDTLGNEQTAVVFATQDKGSGIDHYEVRETPPYTWFNAEGSWKTAESPYILEDQNLRSVIEIRAFDKAGNVRLEKIEPLYPFPWYIDIAGLLLITAAIYIIWIFYKKRREV